METAYFSNKKHVDKKELEALLDTTSTGIFNDPLNTDVKSAFPPLRKRFFWTWEKEKGESANLMMDLVAVKETDKSQFNQGPASLWDIKTMTKLYTGEQSYFKKLSSKLGLDFKNQALIKHGEFQGPDEFEDYFNLIHSKITNLSSLEQNYGKWDYEASHLSKNKVFSSPSFQGINKEAPFNVRLSHKVWLKNQRPYLKEYHTGVLEITFPDR